MPTIYDVAKRAGVSIATVSRILNNKYGSDEARAKVLRALEELQYKPNIVAQSLARRRTDAIALIVPSIRNPIYTTISQGIVDVAAENGLQVLLSTTSRDAKKAPLIIDLLLQRQVDGMILVGNVFESAEGMRTSTEMLASSQTPVISWGVEYPGITSVVGDDRAGAASAVSYLIGLGHKRIGCLKINDGERTIGYKKALSENGLEIDPELIRTCGYEVEAAYEQTTCLLKSARRPTAVFAQSDMLALGAIQAANDLGLKVPDDLSVVGYDDMDFAALTVPRLTTVSQTPYATGELLMQLLLEEMADPQLPKRKIVQERRLVVRDSCTHCK